MQIQRREKNNCQDSLCSTLTSTVKKFIGGMTVSVLSVTSDHYLGRLGQFYKLLPTDDCFFWKDSYKIFNQIVSPEHSIPQINVWQYRAVENIFKSFEEELIYRFIIQDVLLKRLPGVVIRLISPKNASLMDSKAAKIFRITITAALFSARHLQNLPTKEIPIGIKYQTICTFFGGLILGTVKESPLGWFGSFGGHFAHNVIGSIDVYRNCIQK